MIRKELKLKLLPLKKTFRKFESTELHRISPHDYKNSSKIPLVIILDNVRSANNVGSIFRTSDAFLIECIYLCGITSTPPNKDIQKTALGAQLSVPWKYESDTLVLIKNLKQEGFTIISIEQVEGSTLLQNFTIDTSKKYALILGNEVNGIADNVVSESDICIEIPQFGTKHSFNVSVTCGIVLWEISKQYSC